MLHPLAATAVVIVVAAAMTDLAWRRIPNTILAIGFLVGLVLRIDGGMLDAAARGGAVVIAAMPLWRWGGIGAGDVKLLALLAFLLDTDDAVMALTFTAVIGGIVGIIQVLRTRLINTKMRGIPYALPIALGTLITLLTPS